MNVSLAVLDDSILCHMTSASLDFFEPLLSQSIVGCRRTVPFCSRLSGVNPALTLLIEFRNNCPNTFAASPLSRTLCTAPFVSIFVFLPNGSLRLGHQRVNICVADTDVNFPSKLQDPALNELVLQARKVGRPGSDAQCSEVR